MNSAANTNFLDVRGRRIRQGKSGGFFVMKDGKKVYKPTAAFRQVGDGPKSKVTSKNSNVPNAIRRKVRKNAGVARTPNQGAMFRKIFKSPAKKAGPRKVRKNAGAKRMMAAGMTPNAGNLTRMLFATPKKTVRKPAAKKYGPAKRPGRKPTTTRGMMKAGMTPNEGNLTRMLLANYNKPKAARKPRANKGVKRGPKTPTEAQLFQKIFGTPKARKPAAKKYGPAKRPGRKPTTTRGMMKAGMTPNQGNLTRMLLANYNKPKVARKPRAAPKSRVMKSPRPVLNLIVVSPGGTSRVKKMRKPRTALGAMKKGLTPNQGNLTRMLLKTPPAKKARKVRKNKGVKRGPRGVKGIRTNKNPFQALA